MNHLTIQGDPKLEGKKWKEIESGEVVLRKDGVIFLTEVEDEEIKVGDRVVYKKHNLDFVPRPRLTLEMIYKLGDKDENGNFNVIDDCGYVSGFPEICFTKLQKPKEGNMWWLLETDGSISKNEWNGNSFCNKVWDFGFGFHTEEQASFCRDRIKRVI